MKLEKFIALKAYIRKRLEINLLSFYLRKVKQEGQPKPKRNRLKKKNKNSRAGINDIEKRKIIKNINKTKS